MLFIPAYRFQSFFVQITRTVGFISFVGIDQATVDGSSICDSPIMCKQGVRVHDGDNICHVLNAQIPRKRFVKLQEMIPVAIQRIDVGILQCDEVPRRAALRQGAALQMDVKADRVPLIAVGCVDLDPIGKKGLSKGSWDVGWVVPVNGVMKAKQ